MRVDLKGIPQIFYVYFFLAAPSNRYALKSPGCVVVPRSVVTDTSGVLEGNYCPFYVCVLYSVVHFNVF